ncbi:hypothetical protein SAMN05660668_02782 [Pseudobutyrivibrio sp. AR14]|uniref:hypothetical protein n=1 Tax=Pseudobutyrivibrio sp. AR14 TaxID=1520804 RepID=UPI0008898B27|nr:hypothetical protein [Pseudobutyrivibrio sp. AR14]SCY47627.1 hypothetical protein SAMN05660668_02782 [Pseudobutyrivibrio sp. AR14]
MKNRIVQTLLTFSIVTSVLGGANTITVHAADNVGKFDAKAAQMISQVFDAEYYAKTYPDVAAAFGTKKAALLNHYLTCGIFEGRDASATFNADAYAAANADLVVVYDTDNNVADYTNYFFHYINCGQKEGRIATVADATAAGFTVSSVADNTKTIAAPTKATKTYASSGSSSSGGSSSAGSASSSSSSSSNNSSSAASTNTSTSESSNTIVYNDDSGYVHDWDTDSGQAEYSREISADEVPVDPDAF